MAAEEHEEVYAITRHTKERIEQFLHMLEGLKAGGNIKLLRHGNTLTLWGEQNTTRPASGGRDGGTSIRGLYQGQYNQMTADLVEGWDFLKVY